MKNKKILAVLLSIAMISSSLPAYAAVDDVSSEIPGNIPSESASISEGTEGTGANQNDESSPQVETEASSEVLSNEAVNNQENVQPKAETSSEASGNEAASNEESAPLEDNNNIPPQNVVDTQDAPTEQSVYNLCDGNIDVYYANGVYHIIQNKEEYTNAQSPVISSNGETKNQLYFHDFTPDEVNAAPYVVIRDLNIVNHSTPLKIDGTVNLQVENNCSLKTTSGTRAAIDVDENANLTISGSGSLYVSSSGNGAAIGGAGYNTVAGQHTAPTCGNIEITGDVKVTAENTGNGAGIGGGYNYGTTCAQYGGDVKDITIGGNADVTAISNGGSAAIGGGGVVAKSYDGVGGDCFSVTIKDNAMVKATANGTGAAAIGSGANDGDRRSPIAASGVLGSVYILDNASVNAIGGYTGIGRAKKLGAKYCNYPGHVDDGWYRYDDSECFIENTATLESYSLYTKGSLASKCKVVDNKGASNFLAGYFKNGVAPTQQTSLQVVEPSTNECIDTITVPEGVASFTISVQTNSECSLLCREPNQDDLSSSSSNNAIQYILLDLNNQKTTFEPQTVKEGVRYIDAAINTALVQPSVNMDLSNGSITISKINDTICVKQGEQIKMTPPNKENIIISQSGDQTENTITVERNVDAAQPIILENLNISCAQPIVVQKGADVNFIFHNNNSLTATNCQQSTDYPAIEVPNGATVTLSGDGSLEATANGYAAAIGTEGYYRDSKDHSNGDKSSGTVQIDGTLNVKAHSAYGAGIGGGAISGNAYEQHAFDNGTVIIKGNAVVEAFGSMEGSYSAGIGGGGCYTSICAAVGGDGGDVQILDNAQVTAACKGSLGAGIGGGGGCGKTGDGFGGEGESFKADNNAVVLATGGKYGPGIGGGGAQQKTCCATHPGNSGSLNVLDNSNVTAQSGENAENFGTGGHTGGWVNYKGDYTDPVVDPTAIFNA